MKSCLSVIFLLFIPVSPVSAKDATSAVEEIVDEAVKAAGDTAREQVDKEIEKRTGYSRTNHDDDEDDDRKKHKHKKDKDKKNKHKHEIEDEHRHGNEISEHAREEGRDFGQARSEAAREGHDNDDEGKPEKRWWEFWK